MTIIGLLVGPVILVVVLGGNGGGGAFVLSAAYALLQLRRKRNCASPPRVFLQGVPSLGLFLGVLPAISSSLTLPLSLAACGGFQRPANLKLFNILRVLRPPVAFFSCFFLAAVFTATPHVAPSSSVPF